MLFAYFFILILCLLLDRNYFFYIIQCLYKFYYLQEMLDSYLCPKCKGLVPEIPNVSFMFCLTCGEEYSLRPFRKINDEAQKYLESVFNHLNNICNFVAYICSFFVS